MKTIYLIRHSAPFIEIDNYIDYKNTSWNDYNRNMILSTKGENNAKELTNIKELRDTNEIYSSDSFRAIGTAKYIAELNNLRIKLDSRINERNLGINSINELPENFSKKSFDDKNLKFKNGESLNEVDKRFNEFINEILNKNNNKTVIVIHGMILMSYLQTLCNFEFDGEKFKISYNNKIVINRKFKNPDVFKLEFDNENNLNNIENITKE